MRTSLSKILLNDIPTYLSRRLLRFGIKAGLFNNSSTTSQKKSVPVYDIINAGPRRRFTVQGTKTFVVSNCVQSTGHDILQLWARITARRLTEAEINWKPTVWDWHDEIIIEVPDSQVALAKHIMEVDSFAELNQILGGTCPLKGSAAVAKTLAGIKLEE
jgi:hypothetical protein